MENDIGRDRSRRALFPVLDEVEIARIASAVATTGACRLDGAITAPVLAQARRQAEALVVQNGGEYTVRVGRVARGGYLLSDIHDDPAFRHMLACLYAAATGADAADGHVHQVLRCLQGETARNHAGYLHYDSYVVTVLIPLAVPEQGAAGDLVLLPNRRPVRTSYALNVAEKAVLDRAVTQRRLWRMIGAGRVPSLRLSMRPGAIYIFGGYRSLHANLPSNPAALRATLLYHYGNPHAGSRLRRLRGGS